MDFALSEEHQMLKDLVGRFVREQLMPLEPVVLEREASGNGIALTEAERAPLDKLSRELGLWGLDAPEDVGGADLPVVALIGVNEELGKTVTPYVLPPDSPNLRMLMVTVNEEQRQQYLAPYVRGETISAIGISEPGAGADPASMTTAAVKQDGGWILNGRKIWMSKAAEADFSIVMAVTDKSKGARGGISAFLVDKGTPGFNVLRKIPMIGGAFTYEVALEDCRLPASKLLGKEGQGFAPMQVRLSTRRLEMGAWCIGIAQRALDMMCEYAPQRVTFGVPLAERQAIQWWVADAATQIHACRLMAYDAAWKLDQQRDVRSEVSMLKVFATDQLWPIVNDTLQVFGGQGYFTNEPYERMMRDARINTIGEIGRASCRERV